MSFLQIFILAIIQGICELLPVSSSAHVILAEKLMGLDPTTPEMTLLLVMLHTGTMLAVIVYFWRLWRSRYFASMSAFQSFIKEVILATALTGVIGLLLMQFIERVVLAGTAHPEIEQLFGNAYVIASGLAVVGIMIIPMVASMSEDAIRSVPRALRETTSWIMIARSRTWTAALGASRRAARWTCSASPTSIAA